MKFLKSLVRTAVFGLTVVLILYLGLQVLNIHMPSNSEANIPEINTTKTNEPQTNEPQADESRIDEYRIKESEIRIAQLEAQVESLSQDKARLTEELEEYRAQADEVCILVLRYEELFLSGVFGETIVIERAVQEIAVSRELYESCRAGDDITSLELHRLITCSGLSDTRVIVESKYIRT